MLGGYGKAEIGGSEYLVLQTGLIAGEAPGLNLEFEKRLQTLVLELSARGLLKSAHDVSEGGLAVSVAECLFGSLASLGVEVTDTRQNSDRQDFELFGEHQSRIIISASKEGVSELLSISNSANVPCRVIGRLTSGGKIRIAGKIDVPREEAESVYEKSIEALLQ